MRRVLPQRAGLTLVETALLLSVVGVVLAVSVPTFVHTVRLSKVGEATSELSRIYRAAAAYYATPQPTARGRRLGCLPLAAGPTPSEPSVDPVPVQFGAPETPGATTWRALGYEPIMPVRYRYSFLPLPGGCEPAPPQAADPGPLLRIRAEGDLDGDGELSLFERSADAGPAGELSARRMLVVHDRVE